MSGKLNIAVIANTESYTLKNKIRPAVEKRGHVLVLKSPTMLDHTNLLEGDFVQSLLEFDVVYYRTGLTYSGALLVGKFLKEKRISIVNFFQVQFPYYDKKLFQLETISTIGIHVPKTITADKPSYADLSESLGKIFIVKPDAGTQGRGIYKIESEEQFLAMDQKPEGQDILFQEFVPHDFDYRVHVVDGVAICPYKRVPAKGEFRANVTLGGAVEAVEDSRKQELFALSERIAKVCGVEIMGVDLLPHRETGDLYFAEVNDNPGWKSVSEVLGEDPSESVVDYFEKIAK